MKNDQFLKHDASASNNEKLMVLVDKEGMKGYGAYWILLEALRKQEGFCASFTICRPLALRARVRKEYLIHIVKDFDLFEVEEDRFYSPGMTQRLTACGVTTAYSCVKQSVKGEGKSLKINDDVAIHARKEDKIREDKKITVVDACEIEGQVPLHSFRDWEALVDEMAASEEYMNCAGMHSGMGMAFVRNRARIVELFKNQIRLQGKQEVMVNQHEVRSYFSNYVGNGSITNKKLRKQLQLEEERERKRKGSCFEQIINGKRMYYGRLIPDDAPPRPDPVAVWNDVEHRWDH